MKTPIQLGISFFFLLLLSAEAYPATPQFKPEQLLIPTQKPLTPLFRVRHSMSKNVLVYAFFDPTSQGYDPKEPVISYWIMHEEGGHREPPSLVEKKMAFGIHYDLIKKDEVVFHINALKRKMKILKKGEKIVPIININGHESALEEVYVQVEEGILVPSVKSVTVTGHNYQSGKREKETIKNEDDSPPSK